MAEANTAEVEAQVNAAFTGIPPAPPETVVEKPVAEPAPVDPAVVPERPQYVRVTKPECRESPNRIAAKYAGDPSAAEATSG
jgi:hypothetical protein